MGIKNTLLQMGLAVALAVLAAEQMHIVVGGYAKLQRSVCATKALQHRPKQAYVLCKGIQKKPRGHKPFHSKQGVCEKKRVFWGGLRLLRALLLHYVFLSRGKPSKLPVLRR